MRLRLRQLFSVLAMWCAAVVPLHGTEPQAVEIACDGKALMPVIVADGASERVRQAAGNLSSYLGRITGGSFEAKTGDGRSGIVVGLPAQFASPPLNGQWAKPKIAAREDYLIRTHAQGVWLLGATELAVEHAVWDFLYRLGHRQFFPGERWEIVPRQRDLSVAVDARESPAYRSRRIWYGFGPWDYAVKPYADWCAKNRAVAGLELHSGHSYGGIVSANRKEFEQHPEYYALLDGQRKVAREPKFCISNPGLRQLVVRHTLARFEKDPALDSVSLDPSDGGGWCECETCAKLGSGSDRVVLLANEAAAAVNAKFPEKFIGIYAYNFHSPPPAIRVHPNVIVSIATAFIKGGLTLDELIAGWSRQGATLGIREYYSVNTWDRDMPAQARGGNSDYLRRTIPEFHAKGARFLSAESSDNWGPNGLGYYLSARMLWDVREAQRVEELTDDFLARAFGPAKEPMREFYRQLDGAKPHLVADDQFGRMFRALEEARTLAKTPDIRGRIDDLVLYACYASLHHRYSIAKGVARQQAFEALIRHTYRMRTTMLVHSKALYRDLIARDKTVKLPADAAWNVPEGRNPWKSSAPFSENEITGYIAEGVRSHPLTQLDFQPVEFSADLVPAAAILKFPDLPASELGPGRNVQTFFAFIEKAPAEIELQVTGGLIAHYRDRGNVRIGLWKVGGASQTGERETLVSIDCSVPPDGVEHTVKLVVREPGLHKITVSDGGDRTQVKWKTGQPVVVPSTLAAPMNEHYSSWTLYFYVPRETKAIGLFGGGHGEVRDSQDRPHFWLNGRAPGFYAVPVPQGEDGKVWRIRYGQGSIRLLTVPPYFARSPRELLLPADVVKADSAKSAVRL